MIKVFQDKFGKDGNCFSACLASILELNLAEVPNFQEPNGAWYGKYQRWAQKKDLGLVCIKGLYGMEDHYIPKVYCIVSGKSQRGFDHATVYFGKEMVHDPHPEGGGVKDITDSIYIIPVRYKALQGAER